MPPALWSNGANQRFAKALTRGRCRNCVFLIFVAVALLVLVATFVVVDRKMVTVLRNRDGDTMSTQTVGPWLQEVKHGIWKENARSWVPIDDPRTRGIMSILMEMPSYELSWYYDWVRPGAPIYYGWPTWYALPTIELVVFPIFNWMIAISLVYLATQRRAATEHDRASFDDGRRAVLACLCRACLAPIRLVWFSSLVMTLPWIVAPVETLRFREVSWWLFMVIACCFPALIAVRAVFADRAGFYVQRRMLWAAIIVLFGALGPALVGNQMLTAFAWQFATSDLLGQ